MGGILDPFGEAKMCRLSAIANSHIPNKNLIMFANRFKSFESRISPRLRIYYYIAHAIKLFFAVTKFCV